jgi:hypothetical protein
MRLTTLVKKPLHVLLYVLADHRMEIPGGRGFKTWFAGELTLEPVDDENAEAVELLTQRSYYVTKLRNERLFPSYWTKDIYFERSASDEPYREVVYETRYKIAYDQEPTRPPVQTVDRSTAGEGQAGLVDDNGSSGWLGLGLGLALLGVVAGLVLVRRQRSRSKPGEET